MGVQQDGCALQFASEEMKKNEQIVLAAVQQNGFALEFASEGMKKNEQIVLAAVQQNGFALQFASEEMKKNKNIVLAAVQQDERALAYAPSRIQAEIDEDVDSWSIKFERDIAYTEYAGAKLNPKTLQIEVVTQSSTHLTISCRNMAGDQLTTVMLQREEEDRKTLRQKIDEEVHPPFGPASLYLVLPGGEFLRDVDSQTPFRVALGVA